MIIDEFNPSWSDFLPIGGNYEDLVDITNPMPITDLDNEDLSLGFSPLKMIYPTTKTDE